MDIYIIIHRLSLHQVLPIIWRKTQLFSWLKIIFLSSQPNIYCGYSKEPSQCDGPFEHQNTAQKFCLTGHIMMGKFSCFCCRLLTFSKINFFKKFFQNTNSECQMVSIQIRTNVVCPELDPNCLHCLSADDKSRHSLLLKHKYILVLKIVSAAYF